MKCVRITGLFLLTFLIVQPVIGGEVVFVSGGGDALQLAIYFARTGDVLIVAPDTYNKIDFRGKAITVTSTNPDDPDVVAGTIIDAGGVGSAVTFADSEGRDSILHGFTITGGSGTKPGVSYLGGGIYCRGASPTICQNVITGNILANDGGGSDGGGIWAGYGGHPLVYKNIISDNQAHRGAGIYSFVLTQVRNNVVRGNTALSRGGGVYLREEGSTVANNLVYGNRANFAEGGGVYLRGANNCVVRGNTIVGNSSVTAGANLDIEFCDDVDVLNNIISDATTGAGVYLYSSAISFGYNNVWNNEGGNYVGLPDMTGMYGNISAEPMWFGSDYHLGTQSPCINSGDPGYVGEPNETDIDGETRIVDGCVDIGADEYVPAVEFAMKFTPGALNPNSHGKWVKTHFVLPEGYGVEDVDSSSPLVIEPLGIESAYVQVFVNDDGFVAIEAGFDRAAFCGAGLDGAIMEVTVLGSLTNGERFYGTDTVRIRTNAMHFVAGLATRWLAADCSNPDWCEGHDLNQDAKVNFIDFALFEDCCIEVVSD